MARDGRIGEYLAQDLEGLGLTETHWSWGFGLERAKVRAKGIEPS